MADDAVEIIVARLPAKNTPDAVGSSYERCRIAGAPRPHMHGEVLVGCALHRRDNVEHRETATIATVQDFALSALTQMVERCEMCISQIADMDVVPHACAIGRGIIGAEHFEVRPFCQVRSAQQP